MSTFHLIQLCFLFVTIVWRYCSAWMAFKLCWGFLRGWKPYNEERRVLHQKGFIPPTIPNLQPGFCPRKQQLLLRGEECATQPRNHHSWATRTCSQQTSTPCYLQSSPSNATHLANLLYYRDPSAIPCAESLFWFWEFCRVSSVDQVTKTSQCRTQEEKENQIDSSSRTRGGKSKSTIASSQEMHALWDNQDSPVEGRPNGA